jgi:hypothetical protein
VSTRWPDLYLRHYERFFGKPFDVQSYHADDGTPVRVATYDLASRDFRIYASVGLSDHAATLQGVGEIIMYDDEKGRDVPKLFVNYLYFILQNKIPLTEPFTIGGLDNLNAAFADYYDKAAAYFTFAEGFGSGIRPIEFDRETGHIFQGILISWAEQDFIKRHGSPAFESKLRSQLYALNRRSCV